MFQFKNSGLGMNEPDQSNALPNTFGKVRTFKEDLENFEKGTPSKNVSEEAVPLPNATPQIPAAETPPQRQDIPRTMPDAPATEYPPGSPFQSVPTPPPISSSPSPGANTSANPETQLPPFKSSPSQSFFAEKPASKEGFFTEQAENQTLPPQKKSKGRLILTLVVVLVVVVASAGFYYYWFKIRSNSSETSAPAIPDIPAAPAVPATSSTPAEPQNKNLRNIVVDTSLGQGEIKNAIQKFATDFSSSASESDLVEVKIVGKDGQPIGKKDFFAGTGVAVPDPVLMKLSEDYSLFVRKESGSAKLGFVFKSVTSSGLSDEMKNWEPTLPTDLAPLYVGLAPTGTGTFNSSQYKNADIRYFNFSSPADTSLDYSVISNFLIIGTSKNTTRAILDYMSQK
jgi:flagellar basal body-associated protein FliL